MIITAYIILIVFNKKGDRMDEQRLKKKKGIFELKK